MINNLINSITPVRILEQAQVLKHQNKIIEAIALLEDANKKKKDCRIIHLLANLLLETANYQRINALTEIRECDPRSYAIANRLVNTNLSSIEPLCLEGHKPLENAAYITMVKDEEDIILYNLIWHYELGFRKFFLIDNLSKDRTAQQIKLFEQCFNDTQVFLLHDPVVGYYQGQKMTGACRFVMSLWTEIEWLVLIDADEFLCPNQPLHQILSRIPSKIEAIIVPKSVYCLMEGDSTEDTDTFFRRIKYRKPLSHISNKVIMRANLQFDISQGNHRIFSGEGQEIKNYWCDEYLAYREFPVRSHTQYLRKMVNGGQAIMAAKQQGFNRVGGVHWEAIYNLYLKQGEVGVRQKLQAIIAKNSQGDRLLDPFPLDSIIDGLDDQKKAVLASL